MRLEDVCMVDQVDETMPSFDIDAVFTWVDASDPDWQRKKQAVQITEDDTPFRFNNSTEDDAELELAQSLSLLLKHMPWIRYVWILTMRPQVPHCAALDPRIRIVHHDEIGLPLLFNSSAIETRVHCIEGLSEHFLYLNDDFYVLRPTLPVHFFTKEGVSIHRSSDDPNRRLAFYTWAPADDSYGRTLAHTNHKMKKKLKTNKNLHVPAHAPVALTRKMMYDASDLFQEETASTRTHRFRSPDDFILIPCALTLSMKHGTSVMLRRDPLTYRYVDNVASLKHSEDMDLLCINKFNPEQASERDAFVSYFRKRV